MASRTLERMDLERFVVERLAARGITTARDLLEVSPLAIMVYLDMSLSEAKGIASHVSAKIAGNKNQTALELLNVRITRNNHLPTGIKELDTAMRGGLNIGSISEICGPPGVGKTQFCIGCCVQAVVQGQLQQQNVVNINTSSSRYNAVATGEKIRKGVVYIDTELKFDSLRLIEVAAAQYPDLYSSEHCTDAPHNIDEFLKSIKIFQPNSCKELLDLIENMQGIIIQEGITLIVLDSIAALARKEGLNEQDKEQFIIGQAAKLKLLGELCKCSILVTNQPQETHP